MAYQEEERVQKYLEQKFSQKNTTDLTITAYFSSKEQEQIHEFHNAVDGEAYYPSYFQGKIYSECRTIHPGEFIRPFCLWADAELIGTSPNILDFPAQLDF